ncbi:MAG: hypothetical protein ACLSBH_12640 [Coprobacillus cateniformis]
MKASRGTAARVFNALAKKILTSR